MIRASTIERNIGKRYGSLVVTEFVRVENKTQYIYLCACDCGAVKEYRLGSLQQGATTSCGCAGKERRRLANLGNTRNRKEFGHSALWQMMRKYQIGAKKRGYVFELTFDQFKQLVQQRCFYCDAEPSRTVQHDWGHGHAVVHGIDRADNDVGYTLDNSVPCCMKCNSKKNAVTREMVRRLYLKLIGG